jgi:hypothetical protein
MEASHMSSFIRFTVVLLVVLLPQAAFPAYNSFTNKAFINSGAGAFIGEIENVQVLSSSTYSESGTVQLSVTQVVAGSISVSSITFPYQRTLAPADEESNWDLVEPLYVSLKNIALGKKLLIHFTANDAGAYDLFPASNSVQDVTHGLFLGRVNEQHDEAFRGDRDYHKIQIEVTEVIFGWLDGTTVKLPYKQDHVCSASTNKKQSIGRNFEGFEMPGPDHDKTVLVAFDESGICGIQEPSMQLIQVINKLDSE